MRSLIGVSPQGIARGHAPPPPRPPTADLKMVESGRCPGQRRRMFSRGFISSVVNNVFLVSFCGGALRGLFPKRVPVPLCSAPEAGSDTTTQLDQSTHCDRAVWMCGCTCRRHKDTTVQSQCPPVCDGHPWGRQHVLSQGIPHRHSKLPVRYTLPALQDSEPASLQSESLCRSHAAPAGRQVESPRCAGPSRTGGYAAHPLNLGTINVKTDDCCGGQAPHLQFGRKHPKDVSVCRGHMLPRSWAPPLEYQSLLAGDPTCKPAGGMRWAVACEI